MTLYYGFMVCQLTGEVDNLQCEADYKPQHETAGFSYAKWFTDEKRRDSVKEYTIKEITKIQEERA